MFYHQSTADSLPTSGTSDHVVLPPASNVPRRVPGVGFEPTQLTQTDDYSLDVTFEDPAAVRARQQILAALANGPAELASPGPPEKGRKRLSGPADEENADEDAVVLVGQQAKKRRTPARKR